MLIFLANFFINNVPSRTLRRLYYRHIMKYRLGPGAAIFLGTTFDIRGGLSIGARSVVNERCRLDSRGDIFIGENVSISSDVTILSADHDLMKPGFAYRKSAVRIEDHVFIGTRAMVLPGVTIGRGAVIAAGAVVTRNIPPFEVVACVPARSIGRRPSHAIDYELSYNPWLR